MSERMTVEAELLAENDGGDKPEEAPDATPTPDETTEETGLEPGGDAAPDAGTEGGEAPEVGGEDESEGEEAPGTGDEPVNPLEAVVKQLTERLSAIEKAPPAAQQNQWTDERWQQVAEKTGVTKDGAGFLAREIILPAVTQLRQEFMGILAPMQREAAMSAMAQKPEYRDMAAYRKGMDEFLGNFDQMQHADPKILHMAYVYGKGLGSKEAVRKAGQSKELNKKVVLAGKRPAGGAPKSNGVFRLSEQEKQAAKLGGMSDQKYWDMKYGKGKRK